MAATDHSARMSADQLHELASAPDLTAAERRELRKALRFQRGVERWEARRAAPVPPNGRHRTLITVAMMVVAAFVLVLMVSGPPQPTPEQLRQIERDQAAAARAPHGGSN